MITVDALSKSFAAVEALDRVSFSAERGEVLGVLGLNGAGKSTLLRILAGELAPSSGAVAIAGFDLATEPRALRARIGYLPEGAPLYRDMRVRDLLAFSGRLNGLTPRALSTRLPEVAALTHIDHQLDRVAGELSMGYRKRVGIALAVLHDPDVVILDEPVAALDPAEIVGMRGLIRTLGGRHTVLVSSHILSEVHETCDRLLVLHAGALVAAGREADLRARIGADRRRLTLTLRATEAALRAALPPDVALLTVEPLDDDLVRATLADPGDRREALVASLVAAGLGVRALAEAASDLEAVFLALVAEPPS